MIKIVTNAAAARIASDEPPGEHPMLLRRVPKEKARRLLRKKLLEEVAEYLESNSDDELRDIVRVCFALLGDDTSFSEGWVLVSHTELGAHGDAS